MSLFHRKRAGSKEKSSLVVSAHQIAKVRPLQKIERLALNTQTNVYSLHMLVDGRERESPRGRGYRLGYEYTRKSNIYIYQIHVNCVMAC